MYILRQLGHLIRLTRFKIRSFPSLHLCRFGFIDVLTDTVYKIQKILNMSIF
jgi:hypothetical protein